MKKILIVDDNAQNLQVLANTLSKADYEIEIAENGQEAIDLLGDEYFDLILLDIMMPVMNGLDACRAIKSIENRKEIPVIFLTAYADEASISSAFEAGGVDYVTKPFNQKELLARVKTHIELKEGRDALRLMNLHLEDEVAKRTEELRQAKEEVEVLDAAKTEFLDIISHEIRTPLNGIIGFIDLLTDSVNDEQGRHFLGILERSTKRLEDFSMKALEITQLKTNNNALLQKEKTCISDVINASIKKAENALSAKKITLNKEVVAESLSLDREQMVKCIDNIVTNAIKHTPEGGKIEINVRVVNQNVVVQLSDSGSGFPESIIKTGIKAFISANHINANPGLELYVSKLIVQAHKGNFKVLNDKGAKVIISLPKNDYILRGKP